MVVHCGSSASGEYVNTVNTTDISYGRWEGEAIMGRPQEYRFRALKETRKRLRLCGRDWIRITIKHSSIRFCINIARGRS